MIRNDAKTGLDSYITTQARLLYQDHCINNYITHVSTRILGLVPIKQRYEVQREYAPNDAPELRRKRRLQKVEHEKTLRKDDDLVVAAQGLGHNLQCHHELAAVLDDPLAVARTLREHVAPPLGAGFYAKRQHTMGTKPPAARAEKRLTVCALSRAVYCSP